MKKILSLVSLITLAAVVALGFPSFSVCAASRTSVWQQVGDDYYFVSSAGTPLTNTVTPDGVYVDESGRAVNYEVVKSYNRNGEIQLGLFGTPAVQSTFVPYYGSITGSAAEDAKRAYFNNSVSKTQFENEFTDFQRSTLLLQTSYNYLDDTNALNAIQETLPVIERYNFSSSLNSTDASVKLKAYVAEMQRQAYANYLVDAIRAKNAGDLTAYVAYREALANSIQHSKNILSAQEELFKKSGTPFYGYAG